jgi:hypothetical protein
MLMDSKKLWIHSKISNPKTNQNGMVEEKLTECLVTNFGMKIKTKHLKDITRKEDATVKESITVVVTMESIMEEMDLMKMKKMIIRNIISVSAQF